jgi:hypothetical protein
MSPEEIRDAAEDLHKRGAAIHLGRLLDDFDPATASEATEEQIYQAIISNRKTANHLLEEARVALDRRIAEYSNSQNQEKARQKEIIRFSVGIVVCYA